MGVRVQRSVKGFRSMSGAAALATDVNRYIQEFNDLDHTVDIQYQIAGNKEGYEYTALVVVTEYFWETEETI